MAPASAHPHGAKGSPPPRIGLVRRGYSASGGAEAYISRFAAGAADAGYATTLFTTREWPAKSWEGDLTHVKHGKSPLEFAVELRRMRVEESCDFLFSFERILSCDCYRAGDGLHVAWMERRTQYEKPWRTWWRARRDKHHELLRLEETIFRGEAARTVIANSQMVKDEIIRYYGYPSDRIHVVYNGVPPALEPSAAAQARREIRAELGVDEHDYVVLFAGTGWERKGLRFAIEAMEEAAIAGPIFLVAGSGRPGSMPRSSRVHYLGAVSGLARWMAAADVFLLPTLYDPFSNACLEAMAAGLPVITTSANGFSEILQPGVNGEVIEDPRDTLALARAIEAWAPASRREAIRPQLLLKGAEHSMERNVRETLEIISGAWIERPVATTAGA